MTSRKNAISNWRNITLIGHLLVQKSEHLGFYRLLMPALLSEKVPLTDNTWTSDTNLRINNEHGANIVRKGRHLSYDESSKSALSYDNCVEVYKCRQRLSRSSLFQDSVGYFCASVQQKSLWTESCRWRLRLTRDETHRNDTVKSFFFTNQMYSAWFNEFWNRIFGS